MRTYVVVAVGLRQREFVRLSNKAASLPVTLKSVGHISEGSNAECEAIAAAKNADLVLWQPSGARHFRAGAVPSLPVERVHGVTSAFNALQRWVSARRPKAVAAGQAQRSQTA
jgi:hypothetical protein